MFSEFDYKIVYTPGSNNNVDALSRIQINTNELLITNILRPMTHRIYFAERYKCRKTHKRYFTVRYFSYKQFEPKFFSV